MLASHLTQTFSKSGPIQNSSLQLQVWSQAGGVCSANNQVWTQCLSLWGCPDMNQSSGQHQKSRKLRGVQGTAPHLERNKMWSLGDCSAPGQEQTVSVACVVCCAFMYPSPVLLLTSCLICLLCFYVSSSCLYYLFIFNVCFVSMCFLLPGMSSCFTCHLTV